MTVEAVWDRRLGKFKYKLPGAGFVAKDRGMTSPVSSNAILVREVKELAFATGVKLPATWNLMVTR